MADPNDNLGVGGGQPPLNPLGGPSLEAEEKAMRSGKGRMLAAMILAVVAAVGALVLYMVSGGENETYSKFGRNINGYRAEYFDAFWGCAIRGENLNEIRNNEDLAFQLNQRATNGKDRYAVLLRDECMPMLRELQAKIDTLIPPEDLSAKLGELSAALSDLRSAVSGYVAYIEGLGDDNFYDDEAEESQEHVTNIARGWYDYRRIHGELNDAVREKLER